LFVPKNKEQKEVVVVRVEEEEEGEDFATTTTSLVNVDSMQLYFSTPIKIDRCLFLLWFCIWLQLYFSQK